MVGALIATGLGSLFAGVFGGFTLAKRGESKRLEEMEQEYQEKRTQLITQIEWPEDWKTWSFPEELNPADGNYRTIAHMEEHLETYYNNWTEKARDYRDLAARTNAIILDLNQQLRAANAIIAGTIETGMEEVGAPIDEGVPGGQTTIGYDGGSAPGTSYGGAGRYGGA
jgi:hypothetical protein